MAESFTEWWEAEIEQNITSFRARRFAEKAWNEQQKKICVLRSEIVLLSQRIGALNEKLVICDSVNAIGSSSG